MNDYSVSNWSLFASLYHQMHLADSFNPAELMYWTKVQRIPTSDGRIFPHQKTGDVLQQCAKFNPVSFQKEKSCRSLTFHLLFSNSFNVEKLENP